MPSKKNLKDIKIQSKNKLPDHKKYVPVLPEESQRKKAGNKKKPVSEKASEPITTRWTISEYEKIQKKAGLIPLATFLHEKLIKETDLFE